MNAIVGYKMGVFDLAQIDFSTTLYAKQNEVATGELKTPGYAIFNFYINSYPINLFNTKVKLIGGVENIFDKAYREHLSSTRGLIKLEPGRNIFLKLVFDF
jgi:hemoglobin/transferrin/lactoferrin receptor protein